MFINSSPLSLGSHRLLLRALQAFVLLVLLPFPSLPSSLLLRSVQSLSPAMSTSSDSNAVLSLLTGRAPQYRDAHDAVVFALHTHLLRRHLVCHALSPPPVSSSSSAASASEEKRELPYVPPGWNASSDAYSFTYHLQQSPSTTIIMKAVKMGSSLLVHMVRQRAAADGGKDEAPVSLEVNVNDHVNAGVALSDYRALYKDLGGLLALFDSQLGARVLPAAAQGSGAASQDVRAVQADPLRVPPRRPLYADDYDDEDGDRIPDPRRRPRGDFDDDLNPLAMPGGGGSLMGPRNFPGAGGARPGVPGMAPRFDPYGPAPGMGDPDFDELIPPGMGGGPRGPRGPLGAGGPLGRGGGGFGGGGGGMGRGPFM